MTQEIFFGRKNQLDILNKRVLGLKEGYRQNLAIIGDELIGKTSLITKFLSEFCDNHILAVYIEARPESIASFSKRFIATLLYSFLMNSAISLKEDLDFLTVKSSKYAPKTCEKIKSILSAVEKRKKSQVMTDLFSLCEVIAQETHKSCVVIIDEFHNLESLGSRSLYAEWSKLLLTQKKTMYIITSSLKFKAKNILSKNLSLLFGNFHLIQLEPFDIKTSHAYLKQKLEGCGLQEGLKNFIIHFTGGHPFYLKIISERILKSGSRELARVMEDLLFDPSGILNQKFSNYLKRFLDLRNSQDYISMLHFISTGHNKIKEISHLMRKPRKELNSKINHLMEVDTLTRNGDFLNINDRVFAFWMKFVYQEKINALSFDAKNQRDAFRKNIELMIEEFMRNSEKPVSERIADLLRLFEDETVNIEQRRIRLNHFREIKPLEFDNINLKSGIICRSQEGLWVIAFKSDFLTEEDISLFSKECKKYRHKLQRRIIVAMKDIDSNARLRALEEKILTWDLNSLNQILDLYYRPRVII